MVARWPQVSGFFATNGFLFQFVGRNRKSQRAHNPVCRDKLGLCPQSAGRRAAGPTATTACMPTTTINHGLVLASHIRSSSNEVKWPSGSSRCASVGWSLCLWCLRAKSEQGFISTLNLTWDLITCSFLGSPCSPSPRRPRQVLFFPAWPALWEPRRRKFADESSPTKVRRAVVITVTSQTVTPNFSNRRSIARAARPSQKASLR